jgi:YaiO family outer membrane protein
LNYANRFNTNGLQSEIDLYPKITDGVYAYLNYGYSGSSIFPMNRAGAELFSRLPKGMEISAGARYMNVRSTSNIFIYTGSFGIYFKNCWVSFRPYIIPDRIARTTYSASVSFKKFWQNPDNYLGLNIGGGFSPDERRFQSGKGFTTDNIYILQSQRASITLQRAIRPTLLIIASAEAIRQELVFDTGSYMYIISTSVGIRKKF